LVKVQKYLEAVEKSMVDMTELPETTKDKAAAGSLGTPSMSIQTLTPVEGAAKNHIAEDLPTLREMSTKRRKTTELGVRA
jgi:hypothetical protein